MASGQAWGFVAGKGYTLEEMDRGFSSGELATVSMVCPQCQLRLLTNFAIRTEDGGSEYLVAFDQGMIDFIGTLSGECPDHFADD